MLKSKKNIYLCDIILISNQNTHIMSNEKSIKPANGYLMFVLVLVLFIGGIVTTVKYENPAWLIATAVAFISIFGFI